MQNLKRVVVIAATIICGIVSVSGCQKKEKESKEMTWAKNSKVVDNTDEHLQNMNQKFQLKKDYMLYLKEKSPEESGIYQIERNGNQQEQLLDDVCQFVEIGNKIFYTKPEPADDLELIKELCVYDKMKKTSQKLLGLKDDLRSLISVKNNIVYYKTYDKLVAYNIDKQTKEEMDYMIMSARVWQMKK